MSGFWIGLGLALLGLFMDNGLCQLARSYVEVASKREARRAWEWENPR